MPSVNKSIIAPFSDEQIFSLVSDVANYPNFVKGCRSARIEEIHDDGYTATLEFKFKGLRKSFTTRNVSKPYSQITMSFVSGPFKYLNGKWQFTQLGEHACKVEFELEYELSSKLIAKTTTPLVSFLSKTMVNSFYEEGLRKFGSEPGP